MCGCSLVPPIELAGTAIILVFRFVFRNLPVGGRGGRAAPAQIDRSPVEASARTGTGAVETQRRGMPSRRARPCGAGSSG
jgi:iron(III) transport system permease protein